MPYDYDDSLRIARTVCRAHRPLLKQCRLSPEEAAHEIAVAVWKASIKPHQAYNPTKGSYTTYVNLIGTRTLRDYADAAQGPKRAIARFSTTLINAEDSPNTQFNSAGVPPVEIIPQMAPKPRGRTQIPTRIIVGLIEYQRANDLSFRRLISSLKKDPSLCRMLGFTRPPASSGIRKAIKRLVENVEK